MLNYAKREIARRVQHGSDLSADVIAGGTAHEWFYVRVLVSPGPVERNAIVMGGAVATLHEPTLLMKPEMLQDEMMAELQGMRFRGARRSWNSPTADAVLSGCVNSDKLRRSR